MDKRRRRFVMHDVYFLDDPLGVAVFDTFGAAGVALWMGFIAACKKNHIQGEMSYSDPAEALAVLGLPGMALVRPDGGTFTLDEFWTLLGDHKVTRRRQSGRRLHVASTRWTEWQVNPRRPKTDTDNRRSEGVNTDTLPDDYCDETALDTDTDTETDTSSSPGLSAVPIEDERVLEVWKEIARRKLSMTNNVGNIKAWTAKVIAEDRSDLIDDARRYARDYPEMTVSQMAGVLMGEKNILRFLRGRTAS